MRVASANKGNSRRPQNSPAKKRGISLSFQRSGIDAPSSKQLFTPTPKQHSRSSLNRFIIFDLNREQWELSKTANLVKSSKSSINNSHIMAHQMSNTSFNIDPNEKENIVCEGFYPNISINLIGQPRKKENLRMKELRSRISII